MVRYVDLITDTICSPITAPGYAGVSVIRISGSKALQKCKKILLKLSDKPETHKQHLLKITNLKNEVIDQALVTYFEQGQSFTGDEALEISCHGNPLIVNQIINCLLELGCRPAEKGEFSFRAFYNGKLDLVQAESIQQIVTTKNKMGSEASLHQLSGQLSASFLNIEEELIESMSHLEAMIDFVEEDIHPEDFSAILKKLEDLQLNIQDLLDSYNVGKNLKEGFRILLFGQTNAGKSSLFNSFLNEERAIVTDIHGTTRDLIRGQMFIGNNLVEFIDSAGFRESKEVIEKIGIGKSLQEIQRADLILFVLDTATDFDETLIEFLPTSKTLVVFNKIDLLETQKVSLQPSNFKEIQARLSQFSQHFFVSALRGNGIKELKDEIEKQLIKGQDDDGKNIITQARHFNHLNNIFESIKQSIKLLEESESPDLISQELAVALMETHQILGKEYNDEILDKIFSEFCIGK